MKRRIEYLPILLCLIMALSSCNDFVDEYDTRNDKYAVRYSVIYSTIHNFHNIAYICFTDFFSGSGSNYKYTGQQDKW